MKLLVFGATGQLALELARLTGIEARFLGRAEADLADPATCTAAVEATDAQAIINAAAWTAVDKAEAEEAAATVVNAHAPTAMARAAARRGLPFVQVSTDYVFDGSGDMPRDTDAPTAPLGAYGRSKLAGELGVLAAGGRSAVIRTSWVFSAHGANFVKTMLRLSAERPALRIVADQIGGPTPAADLARACVAAARGLVAGTGGGIYHFAGAPDTSWADFARSIFSMAGRETRVEDIPTSAYPTPARRPLNSRLDCSRFTRDFGLERPDWRVGLTAVLNELGALRSGS